MVNFLFCIVAKIRLNNIEPVLSRCFCKDLPNTWELAHNPLPMITFTFTHTEEVNYSDKN